MIKQLVKCLVTLILQLKKTLGRENKELITALMVALCVLILRSMGLLQSLELAAFDQLFHLRPDEPPDHRITIVAIDESSLHQIGSWPIPDVDMAELLQKIQVYQPRAIGLDIYRDLPVQSGYEQLAAAYQSMPNLIGTQLLANTHHDGVLPPQGLNERQVGFNNLLYDSDGKVRRSLLYWHVGEKVHESFALKLALLYLQAEGITPQKAANNSEYLQLGQAVFTRFQANDAAYVRADAKGYQIVSNFPKPGCHSSSVESCGYLQVSMRDVLENQVPKSLISDRIVLIGSTAPSLQDFVFIPHSSPLIGTAKPIPGIRLQAYFISELISAALGERPLLKFWSDNWEYLWIVAWSYAGSMVTWRIRHPIKSILIILLSCGLLFAGTYLAFLSGWWIPIIPALLAFASSAIWITFNIAYIQDELRRSKEFLQEVINKIADPIFVKNKQYQWIIVNDAYCQLIGYSQTVLLEKSDYEFFPQHEAIVFRQQDQLVFETQQTQENEEEFTDATGNTHFIATKRSLHKDAAGNLFLVGVIRDITQRKLMEEQLKRTAAELFHFNNELKLKEEHLRYLTNHDPLTGLTNRKFFAEQLQESLIWAQNYNLLLALLFIDLDGFKHINDTLGHDVGDLLLVSVAQRLSNTLRDSDIVSRLGGDEFTIILRTVPNVQVAAKIAEKILASIVSPFILKGHNIQVSASVGISIYPTNGQDAETLIRQADAAMYCAKHRGKNCYEFA